MSESENKIRVRVKLFGYLRQVSPQPVLNLEVGNGISVGDLIIEMTNQLGDNFRRAMLDSGGNLHGGIEIILKQEILPARKLKEISLIEDCELLIVPMIEGG